MQGKGKLYNKKAELIFEGEFNENKIWNGYGKEYFNQEEEDYESNLIIKYEGEYHNGKKNGKGKEFCEKGQAIFEGIFLNDELYEGIKKEYNEEGKIIMEGGIKKGKLNGKVKISKNDFEFDGEYLDDYGKEK